MIKELQELASDLQYRLATVKGNKDLPGNEIVENLIRTCEEEVNAFSKKLDPIGSIFDPLILQKEYDQIKSNIEDILKHINERLCLELDRITKIYFKAQEAYIIVKYLCEDDKDEEVCYIKRLYMFFSYSRIVYWQIAVIEISKLYSESDHDKFNIKKFIRKLKKVGGDFASINIDESKIIDWENRISSHKKLIKNLKDQRDKLYAHDHIAIDKIKNIISLKDFQDLLQIPRDLIYEVNISYFKRGVMFDIINAPMENLKSSIEKLAKEKRDSMEKWRPWAEAYGLEDELPRKP